MQPIMQSINTHARTHARTHTQLYQQEIAYNDLKSLNQDKKATDNLILYLRGLKTNFEKLQILNKRLKIKLYVIVCAETGNLEHYQYYKL